MFASDYDGRTALHQACQAGQLDAVKFLVALKDADVNVKDHDGDTPTCDAVTNGHTEVAEFLKANGGVLSLQDGALCIVRQMYPVCLLYPGYAVAPPISYLLHSHQFILLCSVFQISALAARCEGRHSFDLAACQGRCRHQHKRLRPALPAPPRSLNRPDASCFLPSRKRCRRQRSRPVQPYSARRRQNPVQPYSTRRRRNQTNSRGHRAVARGWRKTRCILGWWNVRCINR